MPGLLKPLIASLFTSPQRRGRRRRRDAVAIIESDQRSGSTEHLQRIADLVQDELDKFDQRLSASPNNRDGLIYDLQQKHKEARRRRDYALFSAITLVLINLRASELGEHGEAAIQTIDHFIANPQLQGKDD